VGVELRAVRLHQAAKVLFGRAACGSGSHLNVTRPGEQVKLIGVTTQTAARLLERERELTELENALTGAQQGRDQVVLVEAPAGLGKTSLLRAASETAAQAGLTVVDWTRGNHVRVAAGLAAAAALTEALRVD
jgi:uncharacterized protein (DUF2345 family)